MNTQVNVYDDFVRMITRSLLVIALIVVCAIAFASKAHAVGSAGFENAALSTRSLAKGNAVVADPKDPSTVAFNPAGLTKLEGNQVYTGTSIIHNCYGLPGG